MTDDDCIELKHLFVIFSTKQDAVTACYSEIYNSTPFPKKFMYNIYYNTSHKNYCRIKLSRA